MDKLVWMERYSSRGEQYWPGQRHSVLAVTRSRDVTRCRRINGMRIEVDVKMQKCKASRQFQSWYSVNGPNLTVSSRRKGRRFREESRREGTRGSARKESMNPPRVYFMMGDVTWVEREGMTNRRTIKEWLTRSKFHFASLGEGQLVLFTWI